MLRNGFLALIASFSLATPLCAQEDADGTADHPLLTRYPGFYITDVNGNDFDQARMIAGPMENGDLPLIDLSGQISNTIYKSNDGTISGFQLISNYKEALDALGAEILFYCTNPADCGGSSTDFYNAAAQDPLLFGGPRIEFFPDFGVLTAKVTQDGQSAHVMIVASASDFSDDRAVFQAIVTRNDMATGKVGIGSVADITASVDDNGTVVLDGVQFDFDTADLTAESAAVLDTIAAYLQANPESNFFVVGHTDSAGNYDYNLTLSQSRAEAVNAALIARGIATDRLQSVGIGPVAPVASNLRDAGQAQNRRVELVLRP